MIWRWTDIRPSDVIRDDDRWVYGGGGEEEDPSARWVEHPLHGGRVKLVIRGVPTLGIAVEQEGLGEPYVIFAEEETFQGFHHPLDFVPDGGDPEWLHPELRDWLALKQIPFREFLEMCGLVGERPEPIYRFTVVERRMTKDGWEETYAGGWASPPAARGAGESLDWGDLMSMTRV